MVTVYQKPTQGIHFDIDQHVAANEIAALAEEYPNAFLSNEAINKIQKTTQAFYRCKQLDSPYDNTEHPEYEAIKENKSTLNNTEEIEIVGKRARSATNNVRRKEFVNQLSNQNFWEQLYKEAEGNSKKTDVLDEVQAKVGMSAYVGFKPKQLLAAKPICEFTNLFDTLFTYVRSLNDILQDNRLTEEKRHAIGKYIEYLTDWQQLILSENLVRLRILRYQALETKEANSVDLIRWAHEKLRSENIIKTNITELESDDSKEEIDLRDKVLSEIQSHNSKKNALHNFIINSGSNKKKTSRVNINFQGINTTEENDIYHQIIESYQRTFWIFFLNKAFFANYFRENTRFLSIELRLETLKTFKGDSILASILDGKYGSEFEKIQSEIQEENDTVIQWRMLNWFLLILYQVQVSLAYAVNAKIENIQLAAFKNKIDRMHDIELLVSSKFSSFMDGDEYFTPEEIEKIIDFCYSSISELLTLFEKDGRYQALYKQALEYTDAIMQRNMLVKDLSTENKTDKSVGDLITDLLENKRYGSLGKYLEYLEQKYNKKVPQDIQHYRTALQLFSSGIIQHLEEGNEEAMDFVFNSEPTKMLTIPGNINIIYSDLKDIHHLGKKLENEEHISDKEILECKNNIDYLKKVHALDKDCTQLLGDIYQHAEKQLKEEKPKSNILSFASLLFFMGSKNQKALAKSHIEKNLKEIPFTDISYTLKQ